MRALLALLAVLCAGCAREQPSDAVIALDVASIDAIVNGQSLREERLQLPLHWDVRFRGRYGRAQLQFEFAAPPQSRDPNAPYMLFVTRIASAYSVSLNGVLLASAGKLDAYGDRWSAKHPVGILFPGRLLQDSNELIVQLRGDAGRRAGLSPILLGPAHLLEPMRARAVAFRVGLTLSAAFFSLLVAGFCLLLWLQQREKLYAYAAIGEAIWALVVADVVLEWTPLRWPLWGFALLLLRALWIWALYVIVEQVFGAPPRRERRALQIILLAVPLCIVVAALMESPAVLRIWRGVATIFSTALVIRLLWSVRRAYSPTRLLLALSMTALLAAGVHDALSARLFAQGYDDAVWAKYMGALLGMTIMWIVSLRFRQARRQALDLQASLELRVRQRERELSESFARLAQAERAQAVSAERERILRDMHDGVGANLATAMRQLETGAAAPAEVAATLRESLDHLKLSIDAMNLPVGDVNALLASLRYRLQSRIESAGLTLEWRVDLLPSWERGTDMAMRHLQFLLLEAISNVLQHAQARTLTISAVDSESTIDLAIQDDGVGMQSHPGHLGGQGLQSMRARAAAIGAELAFEAANPGTRVRVSLSK